MEIHMKKVKNDVFYVGVNDHQLDLFEGHYIVPNGMAYNSYVILDDKVAVMDSIEAHFFDEWLGNIKEVIKDRKVDYLVVHHMEPDHSANIKNFLEVYPDTTVVASMQAFKMMSQFFPGFEPKNKLIVKERDILPLGKHQLRFIGAPMIHWPEVMFSYLEEENILFSADAFGKFGALDVEEEWACEARRYYFGIVGKFGVQVQAVLKKLAPYKIDIICPLHGPILDKDLDCYLNLYNIWSSYGVEKEGVAIFYTSVYGHTKEAVLLLQEELLKLGCEHVAVNDLAREDMAECVEDAFKYGRIVLATTTFNMQIFPYMNEFINSLVERNYQNKTIGFIENGSWAPAAGKVMKEKLQELKNITYVEPMVKILSAVNDKNKEEIKELAKAMLK